LKGDYYPYLESLRGKRILGVNPPVRDFSYFDLWAKPLGLLYILQWLRDRGNRVDLIDCIYESRDKAKKFGCYKSKRTKVRKPTAYRRIPRNYWHFGLGENEFLSRLESVEKPDVVLVTSAMTYWYEGVWWAIDLIGKVYPDVPVLLGGIYAQLCPDHARRSGADCVQTSPFPIRASHPAMNLYDSPEYGVVATSWGCPLGCAYCASRILCPEFRQRGVEEVAGDLEFQLSSGPVKDVAFYDDALLVNKEKHFYPICEMIERRFGSLRFHTPNGLHVRQIDEKCAEYLYGAGIRTIRLSLESVDPEVQKESSSKVSRDQYRRGVENLLKAGYGHDDLETYVLIGLPGQSPEGIKETISFVKDLGARVKTAEFSPIPGTVLYREAIEKVPSLADEPLLQNNTVYCTWVSGGMTPERLQELKDFARR